MSASIYNRARARFDALTAREQRTVRLGLVGGGTLLTIVLLLALQGAAHRADARITAKRADLAYIQSVLPELNAAPAQAAGQSLVAVVDETAANGGLKDALKGTEPSGTEGVVVRFEAAPLPALLTWLVRIQREYSAKVTTATLEKTSNNGEVNAIITLIAP